MNPKAILTAGAWLMSVAIVAGLVYASFDLDPSWFKQDKLIWQDWDLLRKLLAVVCVITGLVVATYPGVLLGRHKGRPFWVGPGIMTLFMLSSIVTGASAHFVSALIYPPGSVPGIWHNLPTFVGGLLFSSGSDARVYLDQAYGTTAAEAASALKWINGQYATASSRIILGEHWYRWCGHDPVHTLPGYRCMAGMVGGCGDALLVVYAVRTHLAAGEQKYRKRLPPA